MKKAMYLSKEKALLNGTKKKKRNEKKRKGKKNKRKKERKRKGLECRGDALRE